MSRGSRQSTTPMDFEWSNQSGPVDASSPFLTAAQSAKKRTHSVLDSPSKGFATPSRLREPDGRPFYFSQDTSKPLPVPPHVQHVWEPRTPASNYDASSGGETPNTPQVDSDAATPDTQMASKFGRLDTGDGKKTATRRDSWFKRTFMSGSPSPTKDREKDKEQKYYSKKAENRITKRRAERSERSRSKKRIALRDAGEESENEAPKPPAPVQQSFFKNVGDFFSWIANHPTLPFTLSHYAQLGVNLFLGGFFVYIVYYCWQGIMADVDIEAKKHMAEISQEILNCKSHFDRNQCSTPVPAMEAACGVWETCMSRDPYAVARASVTAKTFAQIFNSFFEALSWKTLIATAVIIFGGFNLSNWAFGLLRSQQHTNHMSTPNLPDYPPQTPHRIPSNGYIDYNGQFSQHQLNWQQQNQTPYQTPYGSMRHIEGPPQLLHAQSMPAVPTVPEVEEKKSKKKALLW